MKPLGPDEGMNALRHPDCRFCDEYERLMRGPTEEVRQLKARVQELEGSAGASEKCRCTEKAQVQQPTPASLGEGREPETPEQIGRRVREETERSCGGEFSSQDRLAIETVIADVVRENFCPCGERIEPGTFMCPSCLEHADAD